MAKQNKQKAGLLKKHKPKKWFSCESLDNQLAGYQAILYYRLLQ